MLLAMLVMGCEDATPNWDLLEPFGVVESAQASPLTPSPPPRLASQLRDAEDALEGSLAADGDADDAGDGQADASDSFDNPWGPNAGDEPALEPVDEPEPALEPEPAEQPETSAPAMVDPFGLPSSAAWGVRLLGTLHNAQPPRAALGLPDGTEVVVAPGSMLPSVGMVVITVGQDTVQVARVSPAGDHAEVEMVNLVAQYARTAAVP